MTPKIDCYRLWAVSQDDLEAFEVLSLNVELDGGLARPPWFWGSGLRDYIGFRD